MPIEPIRSFRFHLETSRLEWPTVILAVSIYGAFLALTFWWDHLPLAAVMLGGGWLIAWQGSLQHEVIHGHPTRNQAINDAIGSVPLSLWLPYEIYRQTHLVHHHDEFLTDPIDDPESAYVTKRAWQAMGRPGRWLADFNMTLLGRLTIGPAVMILSFLAGEVNLVRTGTPGRARIWAKHLAAIVPVMIWVTVVCGMPLWLYLVGFVYFGAAFTRLRSFAEHRYADEHEERTAVVEGSRIFGLLFLYNNLHVLHHLRPGIAWYRLPAVYRANRDQLLQHNGGLVYRGYFDVARRFFLTRHDDPQHPQHS
ncbi:fatty acid desaturase [Pararhizobium sp.]|uniref:fatty acid desaturase n=1 Tax=Pararhizobium sp. TaxID=1977563 RepID=UPI002717CF03|nr:fatty acid desaturase [Pararhizobium sp.]MDO9418049.1 fatty acid desaturase [Pararhizobium sp.]